MIDSIITNFISQNTKENNHFSKKKGSIVLATKKKGSVVVFKKTKLTHSN